MDIWTIGLDMNGDQSIQNFDVGNQFLAFFIGSEENGLSNEIQNIRKEVSDSSEKNRTEIETKLSAIGCMLINPR